MTSNNTGLQIAPYWNWNVMLYLEQPPRWYLQIAPYWNWNSTRSILRSFRPSAPNRTILELKLEKTVAFELTFHSPNRTILELKRFKYFINRDKCAGSKSHHTGIETKARRNQSASLALLQIAPYWNWNRGASFRVLRLSVPPNRTILELKQFIMKLSPCTDACSKSHHTGIETMMCNYLIVADISPNRTILELKPR